MGPSLAKMCVFQIEHPKYPTFQIPGIECANPFTWGRNGRARFYRKKLDTFPRTRSPTLAGVTLDAGHSLTSNTRTQLRKEVEKVGLDLLFLPCFCRPTSSVRLGSAWCISCRHLCELRHIKSLIRPNSVLQGLKRGILGLFDAGTSVEPRPHPGAHPGGWVDLVGPVPRS